MLFLVSQVDLLKDAHLGELFRISFCCSIVGEVAYLTGVVTDGRVWSY